jgi:hypothetical protein
MVKGLVRFNQLPLVAKLSSRECRVFAGRQYSSDRTLSLLQSAAESAASSGWTIRPITKTKSKALCGAKCWNSGSNTDIFAFTDADCRPEPDWLAA